MITNTNKQNSSNLQSRVPTWLLVAIVVFILAWTGSTVRATEPPLKVFVVAGQSNVGAAGAHPSELPEEMRKPMNDVLVYQDDTWVPLEPGKAPKPDYPDHFGPAFTFGLAMTKNLGGPIGIIQVAGGGTSIGSPAGWSPDSPQSLYAKLVKAVKAAQKSRPITIVGMVWEQGEADSQNEEFAKAYQKNLTHLIESARRDFGNGAMPFACGQCSPHDPKDKRYLYMDIIRKAKESIDLPGYRLINNDDLHQTEGSPHYTTKGILELGKRYAVAMIELLKVNKAPSQTLL